MKNIIISALVVAAIAAGCTAGTQGANPPSQSGMATGAPPSQASSVAQQPVKAKAEYHKMSQDDAYKMIGSDKKIILLDVRTKQEFDDGHIRGAKLIPDTEIKSRAPIELDDKSATILVYCRTGRRSKAASDILVAQGYTNVYDFGGLDTWKYPIEK